MVKRFAGIRAHTLKDARYLARVYPDSLGARHVLDSPGKIFDCAKRFEGSAAASGTNSPSKSGRWPGNTETTTTSCTGSW